MTESLEEIKSELISLIDQLKAADAADLLLSPHINKKLFYILTHNEGPAMWIVNRSDVFTETLQLLENHPDLRMADRSKQKLRARLLPSSAMPTPLTLSTHEDIAKLSDADVEEILGHPRVPLLAVYHLSFSIKPEMRASSALSLSRRLLEYPPFWAEEKISSKEIETRFVSMLLEDPSAYVRSYCSRIPLWDSSVISQALAREDNSLVQGRLLQHPNLDAQTLLKTAELTLDKELDPVVECVIALDQRLPKDFREALLNKRRNEVPLLAEAVHKYYLL